MVIPVFTKAFSNTILGRILVKISDLENFVSKCLPPPRVSTNAPAPFAIPGWNLGPAQLEVDSWEFINFTHSAQLEFDPKVIGRS